MLNSLPCLSVLCPSFVSETLNHIQWPTHFYFNPRPFSELRISIFNFVLDLCTCATQRQHQVSRITGDLQILLPILFFFQCAGVVNVTTCSHLCQEEPWKSPFFSSPLFPQSIPILDSMNLISNIFLDSFLFLSNPSSSASWAMALLIPSSLPSIHFPCCSQNDTLKYKSNGINPLLTIFQHISLFLGSSQSSFTGPVDCGLAFKYPASSLKI